MQAEGSHMNSTGESRRKFLQASGGALGLAWLAASWPQIAAAAAHGHGMAASTEAVDRTKFAFLSASQARDVDAIAAQIVPSGATPGAREAGVVYFIDQMHAGHWQHFAKEFVEGLADFQARCAKHHPGTAQFADLPFDEQTAYLQHVDKSPFFNGMRFLTIIGLLALPSYGGNADKQGWKLVGFVDQHAWDPPFGHYDREYTGFVPYPGHTPFVATTEAKSS
jgi:gluconate 2-dehydrogenase gamma chain